MFEFGKNKPTRVTRATDGTATYASSRTIRAPKKAVGPIVKAGKHAAGRKKR